MFLSAICMLSSNKLYVWRNQVICMSARDVSISLPATSQPPAKRALMPCGLGSKGRYGSCGWQVKLCDPLVTYDPYLSVMLPTIRRYTNNQITLTLAAWLRCRCVCVVEDHRWCCTHDAVVLGHGRRQQATELKQGRVWVAGHSARLRDTRETLARLRVRHHRNRWGRLLDLLDLGIVLGLVDFHFLLSILCALLILSRLIRATTGVIN